MNIKDIEKAISDVKNYEFWIKDNTQYKFKGCDEYVIIGYLSNIGINRVMVSWKESDDLKILKNNLKRNIDRYKKMVLNIDNIVLNEWSDKKSLLKYNKDYLRTLRKLERTLRPLKSRKEKIKNILDNH